uniref:BolA-like protein 3 n=1 Tax=Panagrolaimus sp. PS1159 TaxID=55785 RepID=A0AC35FI98_9BILA
MLSLIHKSLFQIRQCSTKALSEDEKAIAKKLLEKFPNAKHINAEDISGGCGTMYRIQIETPEFSGKLKVQQHKMVTDCLQDDIKKWHGLVIETVNPKP